MIFGFLFATHAPAVSNRVVDIGAVPPAALFARLDLMFSSAPMRLLSALLVFGIGLELSGLRMLLLPLLRPKPAGLPFGHNGTEAAAARRTHAVLAAEIGVIRGDPWAVAAFTGARFMGTDRPTSLDRGQFRTIRAGQSQRGGGLRARPGQWRGMAFFGEDSGKVAERREPHWVSSRTVVFHGAECL
jgi:hypothetical protein